MALDECSREENLEHLDPKKDIISLTRMVFHDDKRTDDFCKYSCYQVPMCSRDAFRFHL